MHIAIVDVGFGGLADAENNGLLPKNLPVIGHYCLDDDGRRSYVAAVHRATRPGATLLLSCFSDANLADGQEWPRPAVSEETLRDVLGGAGGRDRDQNRRFDRADEHRDAVHHYQDDEAEV